MVSRTSSTTLSKSSEREKRGQPDLLTNLRQKAFDLSLLSIMIVVGLLQTFYQVREVFFPCF